MGGKRTRLHCVRKCRCSRGRDCETHPSRLSGVIENENLGSATVQLEQRFNLRAGERRSRDLIPVEHIYVQLELAQRTGGTRRTKKPGELGGLDVAPAVRTVATHAERSKTCCGVVDARRDGAGLGEVADGLSSETPEKREIEEDGLEVFEVDPAGERERRKL